MRIRRTTRSNYLLASFGLLKERPPDVMTGFRSQDSRRTFVAQGNGLTRGDKNRNAKIAALREAVRPDRAVLAIDLGEDKQVAVVMDHQGRVLARKIVKAKAHRLAGLLEWGAGRAAKAGFAGLTVGCEPTGHRWKAVMGLADEAGHGFCCVQPLAVHRARESDDYTLGKTDHRDAYLIGKLVIRLECYLPERADAERARLRHLGARRFALVADVTSCMQQAGDLLGCCWPAPLSAAARPLESVTWLAGMAVITGRCCGQPGRLRKMGYEKFLAAVRRELPRWGGKGYVRHSIVKGLWEALADTAGVAAQRPGALERLHLLLQDWRELRSRLAWTENRMVAVLEGLGLAELAASIDGMSALSAAVILAETGDLARFASGRALVKHAGLNPAEHASATISGQARISRRGRPGLRAAAWRAVWGALRHNSVLAAKYAHLTGRDGNRLCDGQARIACAAALLRWLWAVITTGQAWDARIAAGRAAPAPAVIAAAA
jgi:transposase